MIGKEIYECSGKTIRTVLAFDPFGYDRGFEIKFTDGSRVEVFPCPTAKERIRFQFVRRAINRER